MTQKRSFGYCTYKIIVQQTTLEFLLKHLVYTWEGGKLYENENADEHIILTRLLDRQRQIGESNEICFI